MARWTGSTALIQRPELGLSSPIDLELFAGCCVEAERSDSVAQRLNGLRLALFDAADSQLSATIDEIRGTSRLLRELADLSQVHQDRVTVVLDLLNIVLPSLQSTLLAILSFYDDKTISRKNRWRGLYHTMKDQGLALPQRFTVYNYFLTSLRDVLTRSSNFDLNKFDTVRLRVLQLRDEQGIAPPSLSVSPRLGPADLVSPLDIDPTLHWAEQMFSLPLTSRTALKPQQIQSFSAGPHKLWGHLKPLQNPKVLFRRSFNDDQLSLIAVLSGRDRSPHLLLRVLNRQPGVQPWFAIRGVHELCISRDGGSLQLQRWSHADQRAKPWANLYFQTWEELILTYGTFLALKARNVLTVRVNPDEWCLKGERKLFQARIEDDGFRHSLIVYEDRLTGGLRLHAAVWEGELSQCPVWTAFVTHQSASQTWIKKVSRRKVRLADVQPYVFCQEYRKETQRRGQAGAFELQFCSEEACLRFQELFPRVPKRGKTPEPIGFR